MSNASGSWAVLGRFDDSPQLRADLDAIGRLTVPGKNGPVQLANVASISMDSGPAQVNLQHLSNVHTGRYTQRVQHDIQWTSVRKEWHILNRKYTGNDTLVTMTTSHLITDRDLSLLCNINADCLIYTRR